MIDWKDSNETSGTNKTSLSFSVVFSGDNRAGVVAVYTRDKTGYKYPSAKIAGVSMTLIDTMHWRNANFWFVLRLFRLAEDLIPDGANTVLATFVKATQSFMTCNAYSGVHQTDMQEQSAVKAGNPGTWSNPVTPSVDDCWYDNAVGIYGSFSYNLASLIVRETAGGVGGSLGSMNALPLGGPAVLLNPNGQANNFLWRCIGIVIRPIEQEDQCCDCYEWEECCECE